MSKLPPPPFFTLRGHEGGITVLHFTDQHEDSVIDHPALLSGSEIGEIRLWNLKTFRATYQFIAHEQKSILFLHYNNSSIFSHGRDGHFNIWANQDQQWIVIKKISSLNVAFCSAAFHTSESTASIFLFNDNEKTFDIYELDTYTKIQALEIKEKPGMCMCLKAITVDMNHYLISGYENGQIGLWNLRSGCEVSREKIHNDQPVMCLDFDSKYRQQGASGSVDEVLEVWTVSNEPKIIKRQTVTMNKSGTNAVKVRHDGKIVIATGYDGNIRVFSWKSLKLLAVLSLHELPVTCLAFCLKAVKKQTSVFASGSRDKKIGLWSLY